jgi:hypothetical protein
MYWYHAATSVSPISATARDYFTRTEDHGVDSWAISPIADDRRAAAPSAMEPTRSDGQVGYAARRSVCQAAYFSSGVM